GVVSGAIGGSGKDTHERTRAAAASGPSDGRVGKRQIHGRRTARQTPWLGDDRGGSPPSAGECREDAPGDSARRRGPRAVARQNWRTAESLGGGGALRHRDVFGPKASLSRAHSRRPPRPPLRLSEGLGGADPGPGQRAPSRIHA